MKKIIFILFLLSTISIGYSQVGNNPFDRLTKSLFENELLSNRFLRNFVLIKTNTYKKRALIDMDQSLAKFDDNLSYIILHLPKDKNIEDDFMKLQNLWNVYRIHISDYQKTNYASLVHKTKKLEELLTNLRSNILEEHKRYKLNSNTIKPIVLMVDNAKKIDKLLTYYILTNGLKSQKTPLYSTIDFGDLYKNLKKVSKYKYKTKDANEIITDLNNSLKMMKSLIDKIGYKPKMLFSDVNNYSKKTFLLFTRFMSTIKN